MGGPGWSRVIEFFFFFLADGQQSESVERLFESLPWSASTGELSPVFTVRDLALPPSRWSRPASERERRRPRSLQHAPPPLPPPFDFLFSSSILSFMQTQHPPPLFPFHPPFISCSLPCPAALLSPTFPSLHSLASLAEPRIFQGGSAPPPFLPHHPCPHPRSLSSSGDISYSSFCKGESDVSRRRGPEQGRSPVFTPDGQQIFFQEERLLLKVQLSVS